MTFCASSSRLRKSEFSAGFTSGVSGLDLFVSVALVTGRGSPWYRVTLGSQCRSLSLRFRLLQFFLRWRGLLVAIVVVVITRPASNLSRFSIHERHDGVVGYAAALDAMIINDIAKSLFTHVEGRQARVYQ